jgi:hypothetical protein
MDIPWSPGAGCVATGPGSWGSGGSGADVRAFDIVTAGPVVLERCGGRRDLKAEVAAWIAVSESALTGCGRGSLGGGAGTSAFGTSALVTSTNSVSFAFLSFEGFQRVSQLPDDLRSTVTEVVTAGSMSPKHDVSLTYPSVHDSNAAYIPCSSSRF